MSDREHNLTLVICPECGWEGEARECNHGYMPGLCDVEPWDYCPECGFPWLELKEEVKV